MLFYGNQDYHREHSAKPFRNGQPQPLLASAKIAGEAVGAANLRGRGLRKKQGFLGHPFRNATRRPEHPLIPAHTAGGAPVADPQQNEGMILRGYENHDAIALVTCAS